MSNSRSITKRMRKSIFLRDDYTCKNCNIQILFEVKLNPAWENKLCYLEIDHIIPFSLGGNNEAENLQTMCNRCNASKSTKLKIQYSQLYSSETYLNQLFNLHLSKWNIAKSLGISWQTITNWEKNKFKPSKNNFLKVRNLLEKYNK